MVDFFNQCKTNKTTGTTELWGNLAGLTTPNRTDNKTQFFNNNPYTNNLTTITVNMTYINKSKNKTGPNPKENIESKKTNDIPGTP